MPKSGVENAKKWCLAFMKMTPGWMGGWMDGCKSKVKDCMSAVKNVLIVIQMCDVTLVTFQRHFQTQLL